jgi:hypothetical protein
VIALAGLTWSCAMCDARGFLQTDDQVADLACTAILHRAGKRDEVLESMGVRSGWEFRYRRKRDMDGPLQITLACPEYHTMTTKTFEWRPKLLKEYDCDPVELGTITLSKSPPKATPPPGSPARR